MYLDINVCDTNVSGHKRTRLWPGMIVTTLLKHVRAQSCLDTNVSGYKRVWAQACLDTNVWAQSYMFVARHDCDHTIKTCQGPTYMSGHKRVWVQTCVGTNVSGHKREWAKTCGHKRVWAQTCVGTNVALGWAQTCLGTIVWAQACLGTRLWSPTVTYMLQQTLHTPRLACFHSCT